MPIWGPDRTPIDTVCRTIELNPRTESQATYRIRRFVRALAQELMTRFPTTDKAAPMIPAGLAQPYPLIVPQS